MVAAGQLQSSDCGKIYQVVDGIPLFGQSDAFYEGKYTDINCTDRTFRSRPQQVVDRCLLRLERWISVAYTVRRLKFFEDCFRGRHNMILDVGCGAGWGVFTRFGEVSGIDLSFSSLQRARALGYRVVVQGDILKLPFPDGSFDYVVTGDVLGHIAPEHKDQLLTEIWRIMRFGGRTIHAAVETHGTDPLSRICMQSPELYDKYFVQPHGHIGYEYPHEVIERFERRGFRLLAKRKLQGIVWPTISIVERLDNEYRQCSQAIRGLVAVHRAVYRAHQRVKQISGVGGGLARLFDLATGVIGRPLDVLTPFDMARGIGVAFEKPRVSG